MTAVALRVVGFLVLIAIGASLVTFLATKDRRWLRFAWQVLKYSLILVLIVRFLALERLDPWRSIPPDDSPVGRAPAAASRVASRNSRKLASPWEPIFGRGPAAFLPLCTICTSTRIEVISGADFTISFTIRGASCRSLAATAPVSADTTTVPARSYATLLLAANSLGIAAT